MKKTKPSHLTIGKKGEEIACIYLKNKGFLILETNYCNNKGKRLGEIDIISKIGDELVFIEVKTRLYSPYVDILPEENINKQKIHKLQKAINSYLLNNKLINTSWRLDAIAILYNSQTNSAKIRHLENIFI